MKIAVIHDYADVFRTTRAYPRLAGHEVIIHTDAYTDPARVIAQVAGCDALLLTQQRVPPDPSDHRAPMPDLRCIMRRGARIPTTPLPGTASDLRRLGAAGAALIPPLPSHVGHDPGVAAPSALEVERLKHGQWHATVGTRLFGRTLGIYAFGHIGAAVARVGKAFGMRVVCWGREGSTARARAEGFEIAASREAVFRAGRRAQPALAWQPRDRGIIYSKPTWPEIMQRRPRCWSVPARATTHRRGESGGRWEAGTAHSAVAHPRTLWSLLTAMD